MDCMEGEKFSCSSSPMLLLPGDFERFLTGPATMNLGCSHLWDYSCGRNASPVFSMEVQEVCTAVDGGRGVVSFCLYPAQKFCTDVDCGPNVSLPKSLRWTIDVSGARMSHMMSFAFWSLWHNYRNCFFGLLLVWGFFSFFLKKKVAAAQNVTTCPFYWQLMLNWSLDIPASTTQVANTLPPPLLFQCWCFNLKPLFFEWMQAVLPNNSIRVTMATAFHCWGWECEKEKNWSQTHC